METETITIIVEGEMMKKRFWALALAVVLILGLAAPAMAYSTPDFSDVPLGHWAYEAVMKMADAGVIKGVGEGRFAPEDKLTAEMFIVLVGRVVFPEVKAEGADWSGPYVAEAKAKGLLTGTNVTDSTLKGEISRYDMAVILAKCVEILKVSATKADSSKVADYGEVPAKYIDAVLMAYGSGLIRGDQTGSFNGQNSMTRQEAATVMSRLIALPEAQAKAEAEKKAQEEKEAKEWYESSRTGEYVTFTIYCSISSWPAKRLPGAPVGIYYKDGRLLGETVANENGICNLELTVDKADFNTKDAVYYAALTDWYEFDGKHYNTPDISKHPIDKLGEESVFGYILSCRAFSYEMDSEYFSDVDPSIFN